MHLDTQTPPHPSRPGRARTPLLLGLLAALLAAEQNGSRGQPAGEPVIPPDALFTTGVGGLARTRSRSEVVEVSGQPFRRAIRVTIGAPSADTNATQMTITNAAAVGRGDAMLATFWFRGSRNGAAALPRIEFLFERRTDPWTKSVTRGVCARPDGTTWKRVAVPFVAAQSYAPGEAMASLRMAFGPQTIEVGGLTIINLRKTVTLEQLTQAAVEASPLGAVRVIVNRSRLRQTMRGFGGNFCQPRYGRTEPMDAVGAHNLKSLRVVHARIGIPLEDWAPEKGVVREGPKARAALLQMQEMARRRIPVVGSVWEGPAWMLGGRREQAGRTLPPEHRSACIGAIADFLAAARERYGAHVEYFSFNEPDYGVNFKFTPAQMATFIREAGPEFRRRGLKTRFVVADTAGGSQFADYAKPLLADKDIAQYLGPLAFHCWDALSADDAHYAAIGALGQSTGKEVWCLEAGHDSALWQQPNPWESWENALRTALAYEKTLRLTRSSLMDYWTYQDNYPLVSSDGSRPFAVHHVIRQMEEVFRPGSRVAISSARPDEDGLRCLAALGPTKGACGVLLINPVGSGSVALSGLPARSQVTVTTSVADKQMLRSSARTGRDGNLTLPMPSRSVVTVVARPAAVP